MRAFPLDRRNPLRGPGWLAPALAALLACSQHPPAKTAGPAPAEEGAGPSVAATAAAAPAGAPAAAETAPAAAAAAAPAAAPEPEFEWLEGDDGVQYRVEPIEKLPGKYQFISDDRVIVFGVPVDIVGHDDQWFYVKVYKIDTTIRRPKARIEPTPEELAEVAATYVPEAGSADRLRFLPFDAGLPRSGQWRNGFEIADLNADGHPDIVHAPGRKAFGGLVVFLGDGRGNWQPWADLLTPQPYDYGDVAVADFNADGHLDVALGIHLRGLRALVGDGKGGFREWTEGLDYQVPGQGDGSPGFSSRALRAADWNGDGRPDLIALGEGPRPARPTAAEQRQGLRAGRVLMESDGPAIFLNQGDGTWVKREQRREAMEIFGDDLTVGDFDGNGRVDFATATGLMTRKDLVNLGGDGEEWVPVEIPVRPGGYVRAVAAADLDGNGRDDLALAYSAYELGLWRTGIDLHYSQPDGGWRRRTLAAREGRVAVYALGLGDLDGDGARDLFATDADGGALVFLGDGKGFFVGEESPEVQQPVGNCRSYHVHLADLDGDGRDEVVANFADEANALIDPNRCPSAGGLVAWKAAAR
jgi:hypothetical protein